MVVALALGLIKKPIVGGLKLMMSRVMTKLIGLVVALARCRESYYFGGSFAAVDVYTNNYEMS